MDQVLFLGLGAKCGYHIAPSVQMFFTSIQLGQLKTESAEMRWITENTEQINLFFGRDGEELGILFYIVLWFIIPSVGDFMWKIKIIFSHFPYTKEY